MTTLIVMLIVFAIAKSIYHRLASKPRVVAGIETATRVVPAPEAPDYRALVHPAYTRKRGQKADELREYLREFRRDDDALMGVDDLTRRVAAELRAQTAP